VVAGPLPAGVTNVQLAYRLTTDGPALRVRQTLPLAAPQWTTIVRKRGDLTVTMRGEGGRRDVPMEGRTYTVLSGGAIAAGGAVELDLEGLPSYSRWPRYTALGLALLIVMVGVWAATGGATPTALDVDRLRATRAACFSDLVSLERRLVKKSAPDPAQIERRSRLVEEVAELDLAIEALHPEASVPNSGEPSGAVGARPRASTAQ